MKTILFDLLESQPTSTSKFHGGGEYIKIIFNKLVENFNEECIITVFFDSNRFLDDWIYDLLDKYNIKQYNIRDVKEIKNVFREEKIDIFYSGLPYFYNREDIPNGVRIKGTVHGLRVVEKPSDKYAYLYSNGKMSFKEIIRYLMTNAYQKKKYQQFSNCISMIDDLICDSQHTRYSIYSFYPEFKEKNIQVFYAPLKMSEICKKIESPIDSPYILLLGGDRWIKNSYRTIIAIEKLFAKGYLKKYKVVVIGGLNTKIVSRINDTKKYIIEEYVDADKLETYYKFCDVFVYLSLNEGFGYPPLEAMRYEKTCVVSAICSLPEICGKAVYYVNPYEISEIESRILFATENKVDNDSVNNQFKTVSNRQVEDLEKLCKFIID